MPSPKYEALSTLADVYNYRPGTVSPAALVRAMAATMDAGLAGMRIPDIMKAADSGRTAANTIKLSLVTADLAFQIERATGATRQHVIFATDRLTPVVTGYNTAFAETLSAETGIGEDELRQAGLESMARTRSLVDAMPQEGLPAHLRYVGRHPESAMLHGLESVAAGLGRLATVQNDIENTIHVLSASA